MSAINLKTALALIDISAIPGEERPFSIKFVKANGESRFISKATRTKSRELTAEPVERSNFKYNIREKEILMIHDMDKDRIISVKIRTITHFNGMEVIH